MDNVKHLKILGFGSPSKLGDAQMIRQFLIDLIGRVGMQPLGEPTVYDIPLEISKLERKPFEDEGGVTSQIVGYHTLSTSHTVIHTWPLRNELHLDIYSCRYFSAQDVISFLTDVFQITDIKVSDLTSHCSW